MKRKLYPLGVLSAILLTITFIYSGKLHPVLAAVSEPVNQLPTEKPIEGWIVCEDLGVGTVPGLSGVHQRVKLCHPTGWVVNTYCLRPDLPVPPIGHGCTRTGEDTYYCGRQYQPLKEYRILATPTPSPTETVMPTLTQTVTSTPRITASPTPRPNHRPAPGGYGFQDVISLMWGKIISFFTPISSSLRGNTSLLTEASLLANTGQKPTPFRPLIPTIVVGVTPIPSTSESDPVIFSDSADKSYLTGIRILSGESKIYFKIKPDSKQINSGKAIDLSFRPASRCKFGDGKACVNLFTDRQGAQVTFITIHSGVGGEAQSLRNALEGTGFDTAGFSLSHVKNNLQAIVGSPVIIAQNDVTENQYHVIGAARIPANRVREYIDKPVNEALAFTVQYNPDLAGLLNSPGPIIILETCGWRMPGERSGAGLSETSASVYLLIIQANINGR